MSQTAERAKNEPVLLTMSILAGIQLLLTGAGISDVVGAKTIFLGMAIVAAITGGIQFWLRGVVVETANVVAYVNPDNKVVAGPGLLAVGNGVPVIVAPVIEGGVAMTPDSSGGTQTYGSYDEQSERGSYDSNGLLVGMACLVIIVIGLVWLVRAF